LDNFDKNLKTVDAWMKDADKQLNVIKNQSDQMTPEDRVSCTMELQEDVAAKVDIIKSAITTELDLLPQGTILTTYSVTNHYLKKFSYGFWDNQWFGRNQICLKLKLGALQFMPGIKNLNLIFFLNFYEF
jgi:hypothetical protein